MNKISRPLVSVIITTGVVATTYATVALLSKGNANLDNNPQTLVSNSPLISTTSIWDKETEPYSGNQEITVYRSPSCG
ncbi:hypothetical protein [Fischerella sp. JS2]|uniref:hypothetical protein n=1 Tax=Fischerella sp. JS2 TaxID=2597771 RepID=UPI003CCDBF2D